MAGRSCIFSTRARTPRGFTSNQNSMRLRPQCRPSAALFMDLLQTGMNAKPKTCLACSSKATRGLGNSSFMKIGRKAPILCATISMHTNALSIGKQTRNGSHRRSWWRQGPLPCRSGRFFPISPSSAHFLLETVGEDVIHTIPRFFYKYRGVEKIAEGQNVGRVLLLAERFSGTAAFAHGLAFCQAIEAICGTKVPTRARALRTVLAELERLRHHAAVITGICNSTALAVATSQAALIEEDLLRLSCKVAEHRYLFGVLKPGGLALDIPDETCSDLSVTVGAIVGRLHELHGMLRYSSSFLDRLEEIGGVSNEQALSYGLVGPVARASGIARDLRKLFPYAAYDAVGFTVPIEQEGDGYSRLRIFFQEAEQAAMIIRHVLQILPDGPVCAEPADWYAGAALGAVEAPAGGAFHWVRLSGDGTVARYRITPPSFANWHGFHLAAENFAFQDFPIILASFGLSNAECDR